MAAGAFLTPPAHPIGKSSALEAPVSGAVGAVPALRFTLSSDGFLPSVTEIEIIPLSISLCLTQLSVGGPRS